jgi:ribosomal protein S11
MAVATGTQIRPELSAVDYTPFLQAASQSAQMQAQGIAAFGQGVTQGIQNFLKKREEKQNEQEGIAFIKSFDPSISDEAAKAGLKAAGGAAAFVKFKSDYAAQQDADRMRRLQLSEMERQANERIRLEQFLSQTPAGAAAAGGAKFEELPTGAAAFAPRQFGSARDILTAGQRAGIPITTLLSSATQLANLAKTEAEAKALGAKSETGKVIYNSLESAQNEINRMKKAGLFQPGQMPNVKSEGSGYVIETATSQVPEPEVAARVDLIKDALKQDVEAGKIARNLAPGINELNRLFSEGLSTDKLTPFKTRAMSIAKGLGFTVDEKELEKAETAEAYFTQQILGFIQQTKGAVSNKENDLFALMGPNIQRSTATNRRLLKIISDRITLDRQVGDLVRLGLEKGSSFEDIGRRRQELIDRYDKTLPQINDLGITPSPAQVPTKPTPAARTSIISREAIEAEKKRRNLSQ